MESTYAYDETTVPDDNSRELEVFERARTKALGKFFNLERWQQAVTPEEWKKVVYVLNRGGRFEESGLEYNGNHTKYGYFGQADFYDEGVAAGRNSFNGDFFEGMPIYKNIQTFNQENVQTKQPLHFINWKARNLGTYRNLSSAWLREVRSDNYIWINPVDAKKCHIKNGDMVTIKNDKIAVDGGLFVNS